MSSDNQHSENFIDLECSLTCSQQPADYSYLEPDEASPRVATYSLKIPFSIILSEHSPSFRFSNQNPA